MFDISLRPLKDGLFEPLCPLVPRAISPLHITVAAFIAGLLSCAASAASRPVYASLFWIINRALDCLDGALARQRKQASDLGGFLDLLGDFIIYSLIPIACAWPELSSGGSNAWMTLAVCFVEASFHVNNFVLFYIAAILEKRKAVAINSKIAKSTESAKVEELTSVMMRPALVEGAESGLIFSIAIAFPGYTTELYWMMAILVSIGIVQRVSWLIKALS